MGVSKKQRAIAAARVPKVRKGQKTPYRKASNQEIAARVEYCATLLRNGKTKTEVHQAMRSRYGLHWVTVDEIYIIRGRAYLKERANLTKDQARDKALDLVVTIMETGSNSERLKAERRLGEILGYDAPRRLELTGAGGGPVATEDRTPLPKLTRERLAQLAAMVPEAGHREGNGAPHAPCADTVREMEGGQ